MEIRIYIYIYIFVCLDILKTFYCTSKSKCIYIYIYIYIFSIIQTSEGCKSVIEKFLVQILGRNILTYCGRVTQICVCNTVKLGTSASSPQCHSTRGNVSRGITPSSTTRIFGEYFLKISVHKNSQRICCKFLKKHSIKVD